MGIRFRAEPAEIARFAYTCGHPEGVTGHDYRTHAEAYKALGRVVAEHGHAGSLTVCGDGYCTSGAGGMFVHPVEADPSEAIKVSGSNGVRLLAALGEPFSEAGSMDAGLLLERAEARLATPGASDSYLSGRLEGLASIARFAAERGRRVVWS